MDRGIPPKPGPLALGISLCVPLQAPDRVIHAAPAPEGIHNLPVSKRPHRVGSFIATGLEESAHFLNQTTANHLVRPLLNPAVEVRPAARQTDDDRGGQGR